MVLSFLLLFKKYLISDMGGGALTKLVTSAPLEPKGVCFSKLPSVILVLLFLQYLYMTGIVKVYAN